MSVSHRKNTIITPEKVFEIQELYRQGFDEHQISTACNIKRDTLKKAIRTGRLFLPEPQCTTPTQTKSQRNIQDNLTGMGKACTNETERVLASKNGQSCPVSFSAQTDLSHAGILLSLPALISCGLLNHTDKFYSVKGYYSTESIFISLAFLTLLRIKTLAQTVNISAGELGRAMGLDRIPEVKTLRERIAAFVKTEHVEQWSLELSRDWMDNNPDLSGILYIDGHVNIYYGHQTQMPKRFVSRLRLCMSGSTDYYVNDKLGQPFFVMSKVINSSMLETIKNEIIPQLNKDVPNQPSPELCASNPLLNKYMIVCDREIYSAEFFDNLWQDKIAVCTYKKNVKDKWDDAEFAEYEEQNPLGERVKVLLAERGTLLEYHKKDPKTGESDKSKIWVREIRKQSESGHQTAIITTNYLMNIVKIGLHMFARWSQENFFKYMTENFGIDTLVSYEKQKISETTLLINPKHRALEAEQRKLTSKLNLRKTKFASLVLNDQAMEDDQMKKYLKKKSALKEEISNFENEIENIKTLKKTIPQKITYAELPENQKFTNAVNERKHFLDTIKMVAYRAETAMANMIKGNMTNPDQARTLLKQIYSSDANISPDYQNKVLTVELHRLNTWKDDKIVQNLCDELNLTETIFPGTDLVIFYKLVTSEIP